MKKNFVFLFIVSVLSVFVIACSSDDETTTVMSKAEIVSNSIIDFPSCISSDGNTVKSLKTTGQSNDEVTQIYEGIRQNIGAVEGWTDAIKSVLADIFDLTEDNETGNWSNNNPAAGEASRIFWGPSDRAEYETMVEVYWLVNEAEEIGFQAYVTINEEEQTAKGEFIWDFSVAYDSENPGNNAAIRIVFDGTGDPKTLMIQATGIDNSTDPDEPENAWVEASLGSDHIFKMSGNYYFNGIKIFDDTLPAEDRNYVFTVIGYDENYSAGRPTGSSDGNKAILQLALPFSTLDDTNEGWETDMWSNYSIGNIFCEKIKEVWDNAPITIDQLESYTGIDLTATTISAMEASEVIQILEWVAENDPESADYKELLFVLNLVNPAYFDAEGFLGTWDGTRGTLDSMPSGFDGLDITSVNAVAPADVMNLIVEFYDL